MVGWMDLQKQHILVRERGDAASLEWRPSGCSCTLIRKAKIRRSVIARQPRFVLGVVADRLQLVSVMCTRGETVMTALLKLTKLIPKDTKGAGSTLRKQKACCADLGPVSIANKCKI